MVSKVFLIVLVVGMALAQNVASFTTTDIPIPAESTTMAPSTTTSWPDITTTASTSSSSTNMPTTTTTAPSTTTTPPPTTTTPPPKTTTAQPTTSAPVTTTVAPTPKPTPVDPDVGIWSYSEGNKTCVIVQMAVRLNITYKTKDDKDSFIEYNLPTNQSFVLGGSCTDDMQMVTVRWGDKEAKNMLFVEFDFNSTTSQYHLQELMFKINASATLPNAKDEILTLYHSEGMFFTPVSMSYHCTRPQSLNLTNSDSPMSAVATISHVQLQAFHRTNDAHFDTAHDCDAIDTPDIVPIAVGCALAGLIVVVLVAYLVGRTRRDTRGYLSM